MGVCLRGSGSVMWEDEARGRRLPGQAGLGRRQAQGEVRVCHVHYAGWRKAREGKGPRLARLIIAGEADQVCAWLWQGRPRAPHAQPPEVASPRSGKRSPRLPDASSNPQDRLLPFQLGRMTLPSPSSTRPFFDRHLPIPAHTVTITVLRSPEHYSSSPPRACPAIMTGRPFA